VVVQNVPRVTGGTKQTLKADTLSNFYKIKIESIRKQPINHCSIFIFAASSGEWTELHENYIKRGTGNRHAGTEGVR